MEALAAPVRAEEGEGTGSKKTAAETVRKSEETYRTFFEEARFAIHVADETGRVVECNRHACDLMGYTREEMLQRRVQDMTGPDFRDSVSLRMSKILEEGMPPYESKNLRKDGASIDIEVSATPVEIEGRRHVHVLSARHYGEKTGGGGIAGQPGTVPIHHGIRHRRHRVRRRDRADISLEPRRG